MILKTHQTLNLHLKLYSKQVIKQKKKKNIIVLEKK